MLSVAVGYALRWLGLTDAAQRFQSYLARGAWAWLPLWGAALALLLRIPRAPERRARATLPLLALALALLPLVLRPAVPILEPTPSPSHPSSASGKAMAFRRWAYASAQSVANILPYTHDADPVVREQAALALGINIIVSDIEHAGPDRASHFASSPLRDSLRIRLTDALGDPIEGVRAEASRALWKAPVTFGPSAFVAETLAAVLERRRYSGGADRASWLALDALEARYDAGLAQAAALVAHSAPDSALRRAALTTIAKAAPPQR
jgi:hypothetical protein